MRDCCTTRWHVSSTVCGIFCLYIFFQRWRASCSCSSPAVWLSRKSVLDVNIRCAAIVSEADAARASPVVNFSEFGKIQQTLRTAHRYLTPHVFCGASGAYISHTVTTHARNKKKTRYTQHVRHRGHLFTHTDSRVPHARTRTRAQNNRSNNARRCVTSACMWLC